MDQGEFRFRHLDDIGAAAAEDDKAYLEHCFVDTGALPVLLDCQDPRQIVVGRTGTGKSATLARIEATAERVIRIEPESLALVHISNSTILRFFEGLGVELDIFFKLLWRHVFTVEILKHHFRIRGDKDKASFIEAIRSLFGGNRRHADALRYLEDWGKKFWETTEYRTKEVTAKLEADLTASASALLPHGVGLSAEALKRITEEQKREIINRAQEVINQVQIRQLSDIIGMLDEVLDDPQKRYYVLIDRLDEGWVEDRLRYRLVRALIGTARDFRKVRNVKLIIALRLDLIRRVFRLTRDAGFQEEKFESLFLRLRWERGPLLDVMDKRLNHLIMRRYTKRALSYRDVFPSTIDGEPIEEFILERTFMRPRDVIQFVNAVIRQASNKPRFGVDAVKAGEGEYSRERLRSLADEWSADYPTLLKIVRVLAGKPARFAVCELTPQDCDSAYLDIAVEDPPRPDLISTAARQLANSEIGFGDFRSTVVSVFYEIGLVGLKTAAADAYSWAVEGDRAISRAEITADSRMEIHAAFHRVLGVATRKTPRIRNPSNA